MAKYKWGKSSIRRMEQLDNRLIRVLNRALKYGLMDMSVICTVRSSINQGLAYIDGKSEVNWPDSKHNITNEGDKAMAVDVAPYVNGAVSYNREQCCILAGILLAAAREAGVNVRSGANWDMDGEFITDQQFVDAVHFELI